MEAEKKSKKKKGMNGFVTFLIVFFVLVIVCAGGAYAVGNYYFMDHYAYGTYINGQHVFSQTKGEVQAFLEKDIDKYQITVQQRTRDGGSNGETFGTVNIGLHMVIGKSLDEVLESQSGFGWISSAINGRNIEVERMVAYDETKFENVLNQLQCFNDAFVQEPVNAYIDKEAVGGPAIVKEVQGNLITDKAKVKTALSDAILSMEPIIDLENYDVYAKPEITEDNAELKEELERFKEFSKLSITYHFGDQTEVLEGEEIYSWLTFSEDGKSSVDTQKITDYIAKLRQKYDTIYRNRTFETSYGQSVTITEGDYGWWMNYKKEEAVLKEMIEAGEGGDRTPEYYQTANAYGDKDWGDTYIEANLTAQHLFYYENGVLVLESDFVSGKSTEERKTPTGIYGITYKERFATLKGTNYSSPVSYWMPFNQNVGLHDATWRKQFGSNIYKSNGSHGCLNLPCAFAKELYARIQAGTPVIVYELDGTASGNVTNQSDNDIAQTVIDAIDQLPRVSNEKKVEVIQWLRDFYKSVSKSIRKKVTNYKDLKNAEAAVKNGTYQAITEAETTTQAAVEADGADAAAESADDEE